MTTEYIENKCGLYNGIRFEELRVDTFYDDKTPKIYTVLLAFEGHFDKSKTGDLNRIYFSNSNGIYIWWTDTTTNGIYRNWKNQRSLIAEADEIKQDKENEVEIIISDDSLVRIGHNANGNLENTNPKNTQPVR
ncbi:MAG: hypothetical protein IPP93_17545 [Chitinophagaceae bacterium]|nr:hypothetical protein [Chitinophagaceae bacterium]